MAPPPESEPSEELPRVTLALLRRADAMCPRRLAHEHGSGRKLSPLGDAGFEITNRIVEDAVLWHKGQIGEAGEHVAFPDPTGVAPEQVALYRALARGYRATFPDVDGEIAELGWSTDVPEVGVRLVGPVGIAVARAESKELRLLRFGRGRALLDDSDLRFVLLRVASWAPRKLRVIGFDPLNLESIEYDINVPERLDDARAWLVERVEVIRARSHPRQTRAGADCRHCSCIPGCPQLTNAS